MQCFRNILYIDEQYSTAKSAPQRAVQLARNNKATLTLCHASREMPRTLPGLDKTIKEIHEARLMSSFDKLDVKGIKIKTKLLTGIPYIEIIKEVQRSDYDLVVKSAEGKGGYLSSIFGETDMRLMRSCPCPVWIVKPSKLKSHARIVAAVDPDPAVPENAKLNELILSLATALARQEESELHIVHVWYLPAEDMLRSRRIQLSPADVDKMAADMRNTHRRWLDELMEKHDFSDIDIQIHLLKGNPGSVIPGFIKKEAIDLVVMGTVARTGIAGFLIGNTAEKILWNVDCSVLTVKPESFKSPVKA